MNATFAWGLGTAVVALGACAATVIPPSDPASPVHQYEDASMRALAQRAAFDLSCPAEQLRITCLQTTFDGHCAIAGVTSLLDNGTR